MSDIQAQNQRQNSEKSHESNHILDTQSQKVVQKEEQDQQVNHQPSDNQDQEETQSHKRKMIESKIYHEPKEKQSSQENFKHHYSQSILLNSQGEQYIHKQQNLNTQHQAKQQSPTMSHNKEALNINRLNHLEEIFRHYCTHIFRVGKHMTFERLEYEKVHMTIERFFVFLKDFELTVGVFGDNAKPRQVVPKASIVMLFKKISPNAKDLTFQQFIECIEKLAVVYEDNYNNILYQPKEKVHIAPGLKKIPKKRMSFQENEEEGKGKEENHQHQNESDVDELVEKGIKKIESYLHHENNQSSPRQRQVQSKSMQLGKISRPDQISNQEKINKFYRKIGVDSVKQYRNRMGYLNLPLFRPAAKSVEAKPRHSPLHTEQQKTELQKFQQMKERMRKGKEKTPRKQVPNDPQIKKMQQEIRNRRYQRLFNNKSKDKLNKIQNERDIVKHPRLEQQLGIPNTLELKKKKRVYNSIKVTQQVSKAMLEKLGIKQSGRQMINSDDDDDQDDKYLAQYKLPNEHQPEHEKIKPSVSHRLLGERVKKQVVKGSNNHISNINYDKNSDKVILNRKKSKSSAPASTPYSSVNQNAPHKQGNVPLPKVDRIVNDTKKRAIQMKKQQKVQEQNKNQMIRKIGKAKFLSKNK